MEDADFVKQCKDKERYAYGTAYFFELRSQSLRLWLRRLSFLSLTVPLSVGVIAMADAKWLPCILIISELLSGMLVVITLYSIIFRWEDHLIDSEHSRKVNNELQNDWEDLALYKGSDVKERFRALLERTRKQEESDLGQGISEKDKRRMMRRTLIQYELKCATCGVQPTSMDAKGCSCDTCGNF